ncbi:hypothetical protein BaRGS_00033124, partial [Batillaria attramentaria]
MCLCADHLPTTDQLSDVTDTSHLIGLSEWWNRTVVTPCLQTDGAVLGASDRGEEERRRVYETLLSWLCGPLTMVEVPAATATTREPRRQPFTLLKAYRKAKSKLEPTRPFTTNVPPNAALAATRASPILDTVTGDNVGTVTHLTLATPVTQERPNRQRQTLDSNFQVPSLMMPNFPFTGVARPEVNEPGDMEHDVTENNPSDMITEHENIENETDNVADVREDVLVLSPFQLQLLENLPQRVFVTGPPGTGKSSTLHLVGSRWLGQVKDIHILSTSETSRAMSFKLQHQLRLSLKNLSLSSSGRSPQVYRHHFCFMEDEMDEAIDALEEVARDAGGQLYLLIDEAGPPKLFPKFCRQLVSRVPTVHLWATALEHGLRPACLTEVRLTIPYRCPWAVLQQISASRAFSDGHVYQYDKDVVAAEEDDTRMKYMKHRNQRGHTGHYPLECVRCGERLAERMRELGVRKK